MERPTDGALPTSHRGGKAAQNRAHRLCQKAAHLRQHRGRARNAMGENRASTGRSQSRVRSKALVSFFVRLRTVSSSRPAVTPGRRAQTPSRLAVAALVLQAPVSSGHALTAASTTSCCRRSGPRQHGRSVAESNGCYGSPSYGSPSVKIDKWSAAALPQTKATLQQGLPLRAKRGAAGQFWTFTMSNSGRKASSFAEASGFDAELRMHVTFTRIASRDAHQHHRHLAQARVRSRTARVKEWRKPLFRELCRDHLVPPACWRRDFGPPPVSPVFSNPIRVDSAAIGSRHSSRAQSRDRSADNPAGQRRR